MLQNRNIFFLVQKEFKLYNIEIEFLEFENFHEIKKLINILNLFPREYEFPNENFDK